MKFKNIIIKNAVFIILLLLYFFIECKYLKNKFKVHLLMHEMSLRGRVDEKHNKQFIFL